MKTSINIANTSFELFTDNDILNYFVKRVNTQNSNNPTVSNVQIFCERKEYVEFTDDKFLDQQEPDISELYFYREIKDLGVFKYYRHEKKLVAYYLNSEKYPFDSFEVVVDTLLQFIYLIMLDFGIAPLHTSVVSCCNQAILLFGNSGSGKTTLEMSLLANGFSYFADDIAFLDQNNMIYSSSEQILACSDKTIDIVKNKFNFDKFSYQRDSLNQKRIISIPKEFLCTCRELLPSIIIIAKKSKEKSSFNRISSKKAYLSLIRLTISQKFDVHQKLLYMKRLRTLSDNAIVFEYIRNEHCEDILSEICTYVKTLAKKQMDSI